MERNGNGAVTVLGGALPPLWDREADDRLVCTRVVDETHDVKTFAFRAEPPRLFRQLPGQYITLDLPVGAETVTRSYTISSSPLTPDELAITVKRVPGGPGSNWLHDHLKPGMSLGALGPGGEFSCLLPAPKPDAKYLFLSAGSGITPMMAMTRTLHGLAPGSSIAFVHSARTPADLIFRAELEALARRDAGLTLGFIVESRAGDAGWAGLTGRLSLDALRLLCPDYAAREVYVCGPTPYMQAARALLEAGGLPAAQYHEESFDFATLMAAGAAEVEPELPAAPVAAAAFTVRLSRSRREFSCQPGQTVLEAARAAGVAVPASCSKGVCGTCKAKLLEGSVEMKANGGIRQKEVDAGMRLLCCSVPTSDVVVER
ncbi:hybrid-cluster NAD(P)-dependent oxidoreductase [Derxia lacustris]|uniref:hybrid-cluster NAD(P)-dependent oxidoreductase n=1 Tax=Derxia lacustris TaxID=764842 RepID=UPI000A174FD5|nr:hybrid-cluster NAD(P)-dependent oxidoreductase [Derxia lacustris]